MLDGNLIMSDAQAVTATAASTSVVDAGAAGNAPLFFEVWVNTTCTADGAATVTVTCEHSADNSTFTSFHTTGAVAKASLTAGAQLVKIPLPIGLKRYIRAYYTVATGPLTAGKFDAAITPAVQTAGV